MKKMKVAMPLTIALLALSACSSQKPEKKPVPAPEVVQVKTLNVTHESVSRLIQNWPTSSKSAANSMMTKYGLPQEVTPSMLRWNQNAPFIRTTVHKQEVTHNFPLPHSDVLEQTIKYDVPTHKVDDLNQLDGSLTVDKTAGELTSRCDKEEMNTLALNLADKVVQDSMTVDEARLEFAHSAQAFSSGNVNQFTTALDFRQDSETADADVAISRKIPGIKGGMRKEDSIQAEEARESMESDNLEE